ncbi:hypothetical protein MMZ06_28760 [Burkholderia gladioli]|uniref:hypothetical protein n=1 Tax=Burkholderia gladioli TaxID=28095 RepID=UPI001F4A203D|nr:hypothetical protein [Burkholderia gladioli]MCH7273819.1 hypothetical protein [Burkholderia gladioli]
MTVVTLPDEPVGNCSVQGFRLKFEPGGAEVLRLAAAAAWSDWISCEPANAGADTHAPNTAATRQAIIDCFMSPSLLFD